MIARKLGNREKTHNAVDFDHQSALVGLDDLGRHHFAIGELVLDIVPGLLIGSFADGKLDIAILVLIVHEGGGDAGADFQFAFRSESIAHLFAQDDAGTERPQVDQGGTGSHVDDGAVDDIAYFRHFHHVLGEKLFHGGWVERGFFDGCDFGHNNLEGLRERSARG